jgi:hypothetical protein
VVVSPSSAYQEYDRILISIDNHNAYPDRFKRFIKLAKQNGGEFNLAAANALYGQNAQESINNNDKLFFNSYTILVVLGEYPFIPYVPLSFSLTPQSLY